MRFIVNSHRFLLWVLTLSIAVFLRDPGKGLMARSKTAQSKTVQSEAAQATAPPPTSYTLTVTLAGTSTGTVTSNPAGISCSPTCSASFTSGTVVTLTAKAASGAYLASWSGACSGHNSTCKVTMNAARSVTATFNVSQTVNVLNHIIFMAQENRSLENLLCELTGPSP